VAKYTLNLIENKSPQLRAPKLLFILLFQSQLHEEKVNTCLKQKIYTRRMKSKSILGFPSPFSLNAAFPAHDFLLPHMVRSINILKTQFYPNTNNFISFQTMGGITIREITSYLESVAPRAYQESYDNSGLLTGDAAWEVKGILVSLDCTEMVVEEAMEKNCNLIVAHHPIIFKGLKKLTGSNYVERTIIKAIQNNIAIYAIHTNLDNVHTGVNRRICEKIGLQNLKVLVPKTGILQKLVTFIPKENTEAVINALHQAGAGQIGNYNNCSFRIEGIGTFKPNEKANPHIGKNLEQEFVNETRVEVIFPNHLQNGIMTALRKAHPYEEVAYYLTPLGNQHQEVGSGMTGELEAPMEPLEFLKRLKDRMDLKIIRHTHLVEKPVHKVAVCGGSGSFLLGDAIRSGAQVFITADFKYHEFFDADNQIVIADIGHYESEVFTKDLLKEVLTKKFPTFAINFSTSVTNPISYL
jgi:dinuclear metal center YbgI/SA1388 family protein